MTDTLNGRAAANIRAELAKRRLTQESFAEACGMPRTVLTELLAERTRITLERLETIAGVLDIEPAKLLND
jgi:transcriptional regulator with XRE-family HTH domain